jgi:hypothetical protein
MMEQELADFGSASIAGWVDFAVYDGIIKYLLQYTAF